MKKLLKVITGKIFLVAISVILQVAWLGVLLWELSNYSVYINTAVSAISLLIVLYLMNKRTNPSYKLVWTLLILVFPVFGLLIYALFGRSTVARKMERQFNYLKNSTDAHLNENPQVRRTIEQSHTGYSNQSAYIRDYAGYPLYGNEDLKYYAVGDDMFPDMIEALESAKEYIFLEYFIIAEGYLWRTISDILMRKAEQGVDVRLIYDDLGCTGVLPHHFYKRLQRKGVKCAAFNPLRPIVNIILNNRDHRKIFVVDGKVAFTGGLNLADEYINQKERFGHWKDSGIRFTGPAVWSFTSMFLQMWSVVSGADPEFDKFAPPVYLSVQPGNYQGYLQPYTDIPLDKETVGENIYLNILSQAKEYVYIFTPYLIIDNEMMTTLCLAAKRGVDVRIVTPEIPDKKTVYLLTQSYYEELLEAGVRIYQYTPGFIHSKNFVCDDQVATVGSVNLDYRSLYLHFECGVWIYQCEAIKDIKEDALRTFQISREITLEFCKKRNILVRWFQGILKVFAPML